MNVGDWVRLTSTRQSRVDGRVFEAGLALCLYESAGEGLFRLRDKDGVSFDPYCAGDDIWGLPDDSLFVPVDIPKKERYVEIIRFTKDLK